MITQFPTGTIQNQKEPGPLITRIKQISLITNEATPQTDKI